MACASELHSDRFIQALYATALELGGMETDCPRMGNLVEAELEHIERTIGRIRQHDAVCPERHEALQRPSYR